MFQISAYTISLLDTPEIGRTKINYLLSGGTSPFAIWSGVTDSTKYLSVLKQDENNSNVITNLIGIKSAYTNFNLIFNGSNNTINQYKSTSNESGSYNLISGIDNEFFVGFSGNTSVGSGNTSSSSYNSFIHGIENETLSSSFSNPIYSTILSSKNATIEGAFLSNIFSSKNSYLLLNSSSGSIPSGNTISGINNQMITNNTNLLKNLFILNGQNNLIQSNNISSYNFCGIINGQNNIIDITNSVNNTYIFGSNITANSNNSSHFENLHVDENLLFTKVKKYVCNTFPGDVTIDINYSFHEIFSPGSNLIRILIPNSNVDLQILSLIITGTSLVNYDVQFVSNFGSPAADPTNIACKPGTGGFRFVSNKNLATSVAYFFMWTNEINKWVMFTSDTDTTATF